MFGAHTARVAATAGVSAVVAQAAGVTDVLDSLDSVVQGSIVVAAVLAGYKILRAAFSDSTAAYKASADDARSALLSERAEFERRLAAAESARRTLEEAHSSLEVALRAEVAALRARLSERP